MTEESVKALISTEGRQLLSSVEKETSDSFLFSALGQKTEMALRQGIAEQLLCKEKLRKKLPHFARVGAFVEKDLLEQATVKAVSDYRASLLYGESCLEMTGGLGADTIALAPHFSTYHWCEIEPSRAQLFEYNKELFCRDTIEVFNEDSIQFLEKSNRTYQWIFADPARRSGGKKGSIALAHCAPNILEHLELIARHTQKVALKLSPAYDITQLCKEIPWLSHIYVISYKSEVREIFAVGSPQNTSQQVVRLGVVLADDTAPLIFTSENNNLSPAIDSSQEFYYLFEPDPAIIKARLMQQCASRYNLRLLATHSVFLVGDRPYEEFTGRQFKVVKQLLWNRKEVVAYLKKENITHGSIMRRDFPLSPEEIRQRFKIKESSTGEVALLFTRDGLGQKVFFHLIRWK